jgi:putative copper resistance protein D
VVVVFGVNAALISTRWIHFAAIVTLVGVFAFRLLVGDPAFRVAARTGSGLEPGAFLARLLRVAVVALALTLVSGTLWLLLQASVMSGRPISVVIRTGIVPIVVLRTQAGHDWLGRTAALTLLAIAVLWTRKGLCKLSPTPLVIAFALAAAGLAALVWTGHAGASRGVRGTLEQTADGLHLLAAGVWLGGLVPLTLLLGMARRAGDEGWVVVARNAAARFSALGVFSILTLLATGIANSWFLVGDLTGLTRTGYGQCLLVKLVLFAMTIGVASANRTRLIPSLSRTPSSLGLDPAWKTIRELQRNTAIEVGLGALILGVVGVLGTLPPAAPPHVHVESKGVAPGVDPEPRSAVGGGLNATSRGYP